VAGGLPAGGGAGDLRLGQAVVALGRGADHGGLATCRYLAVGRTAPGEITAGANGAGITATMNGAAMAMTMIGTTGIATMIAGTTDATIIATTAIIAVETSA